MRRIPLYVVAGVALVLVLSLGWPLVIRGREPTCSQDGRKRVRVVFSGGHETEAVDHGRPVRLIAAALGVPSEVFRRAFSRVRPAPAWSLGPSPARARENKAVLMAVLGPYGITNDRLDAVSNRYRYRRSLGELWPVKAAVAYALIDRHGHVTGFEVVDGGYGYTSPPTVTVSGFGALPVNVALSFGRKFESNGSIAAIALERGTHGG